MAPAAARFARRAVAHGKARPSSTVARSALVRARAGARARCIATNFGCRDGTPIDNKSTILSLVDDALGVERPPDLEILLTDHLTCTASPLSELLHACFLRFGHVAVRYTTSDGTGRVMNILGGVEGADLVHFVDPADYLYGTKGWDTYAQQGGAYNRDVIGVRVERCAPGSIDAMHAYYEALHLRSKIGDPDGAARFQLVEARLSALADHAPPALSRAGKGGLRRTFDSRVFSECMLRRKHPYFRDPEEGCSLVQRRAEMSGK